MVTVLVILLLIIFVLVIAIALYVFNTQRQLVSLDEMCKNSIGQIAVQLNSRWDALLALAQTATQYAQHESRTLINVIAQRRQTTVATAADINSAQSEFASVFSRLMAVSEAYPQLKASEQYMFVMQNVNHYEENVRMARMIYNDTATKMNRMVRQWPSSFVASMLHFDLKEYLKTDEDKKEQYPDLYGQGGGAPQGGGGMPPQGPAGGYPQQAPQGYPQQAPQGFPQQGPATYNPAAPAGQIPPATPGAPLPPNA
ncbi:MAG: LemA family protein [Prevotella sp.]|nr:LemA family protein [Prevotella sp.]